MSQGCVWIDEIEFTIQGPVVHFVSVSDGKRLPSRMLRSKLREYVEDAIRALDEADLRERSVVLPFEARAG